MTHRPPLSMLAGLRKSTNDRAIRARTRPRRRALALLAGGVAFGAIGWLWSDPERDLASLLSMPLAGELRAAGIVNGDTDGDGLSDLLESILGTAVDAADTDADGVSDTWELARRSDPLTASDQPGPGSPDVGLAGFVAGGALTVTTLVVVEDADLSAVDLEFGVVIGGVKSKINAELLVSASSFQILGGAGGDSLLILETVLPESLAHAIGDVAFYAINRHSDAASGDVLQLLSFLGQDSNGDPLPALVRPEPAPPSLASGVEGRSYSLGGTGSRFDAGAIYRSLVADESVPSDWTSGEICFQEMSAVGVNGVNVVMQVDSASCEPFDTFCSPTSCQATVGQTIEFVDVGSILGG